ncbi:MAG: hypothetical protein ABIQ86_08900 [Steroidobacteraceae bacterium]
MKTNLRAAIVAIASYPLLSVQASPAERVEVEYKCGVTGRDAPINTDGNPPLVRVLRLKRADALRLPSGTDAAKHAMSCSRSLLIPSVNDAKVLELGLDLFIGASDNNSEKPRLALLTGVKPNIVFLIIDGEQSKSESDRTKIVLNEINGR